MFKLDDSIEWSFSETLTMGNSMKMVQQQLEKPELRPIFRATPSEIQSKRIQNWRFDQKEAHIFQTPLWAVLIKVIMELVANLAPL